MNLHINKNDGNIQHKFVKLVEDKDVALASTLILEPSAI